MKKTEILLIIVLAIIVVIAFTACAAPMHKRDCRGLKHTKQKGGFYLQVKTVGEEWDT